MSRKRRKRRRGITPWKKTALKVCVFWLLLAGGLHLFRIWRASKFYDQMEASRWGSEQKSAQVSAFLPSEEAMKEPEIKDLEFQINTTLAQDSIKLVNPYFAPTSSVIKALKRCAERGVKMDILMSSKYDIPLMPDVVIYNMKKLAKRGARIWRYRPGFHHSKIMMVDGKFCTVGSTNLDARSLRYDYEINAIIIDPETTHQLEERFMQDTQKCDLMTEESLKKSQNTWHKFKGWFGHLLTFVL